MAGSEVAFDRLVDPAEAPLHRLSKRSGFDMAEMIQTEVGGSPADWFGGRGWAVREEPVAALAERYQRDLGNPFAGRVETELSVGDGMAPPWLDTVFVRARLGR